jgi:hypothetical protein
MIKEILDLVFSAGVVLVAIISWKSSKSINKINIESAAFSMLNNSKIALDNAIFKGKDITKIKPLMEDYLTVFNYACSLFKLKRRSGKRFRTLYSLDIKNIFKSEVFMEILNSDPDNYVYLRKAHVDIIEREK